jgi:hypothetical protein
MNSKETFLYIIGVVMIALGLFMTLGGIILIGDPKDGTVGGAIALTLLMGILPTVAGFLICRRMKSNARHRKFEKEEDLVIALASRSNGRLTASELAGQTDLSIIEAEKLLEQYTIKGIMSISISESGARVFQFRELISSEEKNRAEDL